ncbi:MAG: YceI family protein [Patescibacteria group bacterium]
MQKFIPVIVIVIIVAIVGFLYATRPASAPSQNTEDVAGGGATSTGAVYKINSSQSLVEFRIGEILRDKPFTAVGTTTNIAGNLTVFGNIVTVGNIAINARTFKTDSEKRDGAIARFIIKSEDPANEFIIFEPLSIGTSTIVGDLTFAGVKKPVTFTVLTFEAGTSTLMGTATTKLKRSDFGLTIPNVPFVASVDEEFIVNVKVVADLVQ